MTEENAQDIVDQLTPGNGAGESMVAESEMVPDADVPKFRIPPDAQDLVNSLADTPGSISPVGPALEFEVIEPIENHVFIRPDRAAAVSKSGRIILPDSVKEAAPERGEVLYIGPGIESEGRFTPAKIKSGDRVIFHRHSGTAVEVNDEELICIRENGVFGIIRALETVKDTNETP